MKTKQQSQECSVTVAFAELGRLERERAEFAADKQSVRERLARQARDLATLRERFEAERPRARERVRRERLRRERFREQLAARLIAEAESAHDERLALIRAELEAKRLRLAALEVSEQPAPRRRWLEWSVPVAATAMVAFLGITLFDEEQAVAQPAAVEVVEPVKQQEEVAPAPEPVAEAQPVAEPEAKPEVVEPAPEPKPEPSKKSTTKKSTSKKSSSKKKSEEKPKSEPVIKKNSKPLEIGDFGGNPLG